MLNEKQFEDIFNSYYKSICKYLYLFTSDYPLIQDAVQVAFIKLWEERNRIELSNIRAYLYISARSRILNAIRDDLKKKKILELYISLEIQNKMAKDIINMDEFSLLVESAIEKLPPKTQHIYKLNRKNERTYQEIATSENISIKTVESHITKAMKRIVADLQKHYTK